MKAHIIDVILLTQVTGNNDKFSFCSLKIIDLRLINIFFLQNEFHHQRKRLG